MKIIMTVELHDENITAYQRDAILHSAFNRAAFYIFEQVTSGKPLNLPLIGPSKNVTATLEIAP